MLEFQIDQLVKMWLEEDINNIDLASSVILMRSIKVRVSLWLRKME